MPATLPPEARPLDAPLPRELTGSEHGWLTRYRIYPVFSGPWVRGRWRLALSLLGALLAMFGLGALLTPEPMLPLVALSAAIVEWLVPLVLGPLAGAWVRRRHWPAAAEQRALWAAVAALVLSVAAFSEWGTEPLKQRLAEWAGKVDAQGQRQKVVLAIGVTVTSPDPAASEPMHERKGASTPQRAVNALFNGLITFSLAGGFAVLRLRRERELLVSLARDHALAQAQAERREAELRLSVLAAQVEPHFLFNTLAGVRSAIASDPARASDMVDRLVAYLRAAIPRLRGDGGAEATLANQAETVRAYLALMQSRMPRLSFSLDIPPELAQLPFPPLMLISLAENAVRHGVEPKIGPAHVALQARREPDGGLAVTVADDGVGFGGATAGTGLGLANLRERLQQLHKGRACLTLKARPEGGVAATITLPPEAATP
jgi:signal transduction histidine kinase